MLLDFLGKELKEGDKVIFMQKDYRNLMKGVVTKTTQKQVVISHEATNVCSKETKQFASQVIKYENDLTGTPI